MDKADGDRYRFDNDEPLIDLDGDDSQINNGKI